jgi:hypothetical protein
MVEAFAIQIYRRFLNGESVARLAAELEIPAERIEQRIRAAQLHLERQPRRAA